MIDNFSSTAIAHRNYFRSYQRAISLSACNTWKLSLCLLTKRVTVMSLKSLILVTADVIMY